MRRRLHSAPGLGLSKTPTAEVEPHLQEASKVPASQVATSHRSRKECGARQHGEMGVWDWECSKGTESMGFLLE